MRFATYFLRHRPANVGSRVLAVVNSIKADNTKPKEADGED